jgi:hypothetical protein
MLWVEYLNDRSYRDDDYETITAALLAAGARPADADNEGDSALQIVMRLSERHREKMAPLRDLVLEYADADDIRIARSAAAERVAREVAQEKRDDFKYEYWPEIWPSLVAFSFPLVIGGLSIGMREGVYKNDPSKNWMGPIIGVMNFTMAGMALGVLLASPLASDGGWDNLYYIFGGVFGGIAGLVIGTILTAAIPSISRTTNNTPVLYYLPTAVNTVGAIAATIIIFKLSY